MEWNAKAWACGALLALCAACGGGREEEEPMAVEETVLGPLIGAQDKARDRTEAAIEQHRDMLKSQEQAGEGDPPAKE